MKPLKLGVFRWEHERPIDRWRAFIRRITREKQMSACDLENIASRYADKFNLSGAGRRSFLRASLPDCRTDDIFFKGRNISYLDRLLTQSCQRQSEWAFGECLTEGRQYMSLHAMERRLYKKSGFEALQATKCKNLIKLLKRKLNESAKNNG